MKLRPIAVIAIVALFLYWVVQDPIGAAQAIRHVSDATVGLLKVIATRIVQFLGAL